MPLHCRQIDSVHNCSAEYIVEHKELIQIIINELGCIPRSIKGGLGIIKMVISLWACLSFPILLFIP